MKPAFVMLLAIGQVPASASVRVVHVNGATVVIEKREDYEHVTVRDRNGDLESEASCDRESGTYDQIVALGTALANAARHDDRQAVASLMSYPLVVNFVIRAGGTRTVRPQSLPNKSALLARARTIFTASFCDSFGRTSRALPSAAMVCRWWRAV